ncbi:Scr1 family TA system antitoxin-like transcriptional regulator [Streptomyces sp. A1-5]|uniref:Scr1 family TA system antitoxin-like transcriptional regulator n=1 Tax=Streptomyces sp. A1-5 TaxID=2738410 RepID=UPI001F36D5A3|nr:Scr1 family TA system antitoxin-like transcriptional regulator [Streptomyces sp. A1-5]UJB41679.1 hypothetical protein HRD51_13250 [Streptomyces sp. A1-5]
MEDSSTDTYDSARPEPSGGAAETAAGPAEHSVQLCHRRACILRPTGGPDTVRGAIDHVLECMTLRNVEVQVMPLNRGIHPGLDGPMRLLETPDNQWFGYCEGQESSQFITDPQTISTLYMRYAKLLSQALTPEDSESLLKQIRGAL